jgi:hypothetical protein
MIAKPPLTKKPTFWITILLIGFFALFLSSFRNEVCAFITDKPCGPAGAQIPNRSAGFQVLVQFAIIFLGSLLGSLFLISQFVLPVHTARERINVFSRIVMYLFHTHGPAIFVREGKEKAKTRELESSRPGVAFVDASSAIVLEKQWKPRRKTNSSGPITNFINRTLLHQPEKIMVHPPLVRSAGPGIVFTRFNERIIGIADLRKQFRINTNVQAYTADGLEMKAHVFVIFSLGMEPEILKVAYVGEEKPENLRVLQIERRPKLDRDKKYQGASVEYIRAIDDHLDPEDRSLLRNQIIIDRGEVHRYAQTKAEMRQFLDSMAPLSVDILHQFINDLNPLGRNTAHRFIDILYADNRAVLYRIFDRLMPIDIPEVGIYRFAFNRTVLHQLIDEFENYLTKAEQPAFALRKSEKRTLHRFINQLFSLRQQRISEFFGTLNQVTGQNIQDPIRAFVQKYWMNKEHPRPPRPDNIPKFLSPFHFDPERVFHAIYARGQNIKAGMPTGPDDWSKQPTQLATELYRQELSLVNYDQIYMPEDPLDFPLVKKIKPRFARIMRHSGVLSFKLIRRRDGKPIDIGQELNARDFILDYPVMEFRQPKPLRERGIRVFHSNFTELKPIAIEKKDEPLPPTPTPVVRNQRFDTWQAQWQKESEFIKAESELELMHIRSRARAKAQQEMTIALSQILESTSNSQEAMAMRVFQALESAATDPSTHHLLPRDTIDMLRSLRHWLLPNEEEKNESLFEGEWFDSQELPPEDQNLTDM